MSHFQIEFVYPWLLLLLIPMLFLALFFHFRLEKKFRRTRNRITSLVLHIIVSVLCIFVLSGMTFSYDTDNVNNELIIVADYSFSGADKSNDKLEFVHSIIKESNENYKVGVVTFGYNQIYAAPLNNDSDEVYNNFINAVFPDDSATDIASALKFAHSKLKHPETAKIVLISDGVETDRKALDVIRSIAADGVKVNSVYMPNKQIGSEIQIIDTIMPDTNPSVNVPFRLGISVRSSVVGNAKLTVYDNGSEMASANIAVEGGIRDYYLSCKFGVGGMHIIKAVIEAEESVNDGLEYNNSYYTYINVENFNKVLVIEREPNTSDALKNMLTTGDNPFDVTVCDISGNQLPASVDALRNYDQVILNNIANADMPEGFVEKLNSYVKDYGGGLFTVGGSKIDEYGETVANAYDASDMAGTLYQDMLPVQVINYTPPVAVVIIIDKSGSMTDSTSSSGQSRMEAAKDGAKSAIKALTARDYCAVMTLTNDFAVEQSLTSVREYDKLFSVIDGIEAGGGTYYTPAIERAGRILKAENRVERKHIVLVSDGLPNDNYDSYSAAIRSNAQEGITISIVAINTTSGEEQLRQAAEVDGGGRFYMVTDTDLLVDRMREELRVKEIKGVNYEDFVPTINVSSPIATDNINAALIPTLGGFYGTRLKSDQSVIVGLEGKYVPIFAQWEYGEGKVGSFMCDLSGGEWSDKFVNDDTGKQLVRNMVSALMPTYNIHVQDIDVSFEEDNYTTDISVFTTLRENEKLQITIASLSENSDGDTDERVITPTAQSGFSRARVDITEPGVYRITVNKLDAQGNVIGTHVAYRAFSYSKEYDMFYSENDAKNLMNNLAALGGGQVITEAWQLFTDSVTYIHHVFDPTITFIIIAIVLFLLDIAVRKFKWKWIHELVRERKAKKAEGEV